MFVVFWFGFFLVVHFCVFLWVLCVLVCVLFVLFGERFYEGLISIFDSGVCLGPIV